MVLTCLGDAGAVTYKQTRRGDTPIDRAAAHVLQHAGRPFTIEPFSPWGYDERQYNSPGFDMPVGCLMRTPHGRFPEYHTSADNLDLVRPEALADSLATALAIVRVVDRDARYMNLNPKCEPQLGTRGLYGAIGGVADAPRRQMAMLWVLNLSDGHHPLLEIATRAAMPFAEVVEADHLQQLLVLFLQSFQPKQLAILAEDRDGVGPQVQVRSPRFHHPSKQSFDLGPVRRQVGHRLANSTARRPRQPQGGGDAAIALLGGHIDVAVMTPSSGLAQLKSGEIRLLGISSAARNEYFPNVPTFKEQGYDVVEQIWRSVMVRAGTPKTVLDTLMSATEKMKATKQWQDFSTLNMQSSMNISLDAMQTRVRAEIASNREFLTSAGLRK